MIMNTIANKRISWAARIAALIGGQEWNKTFLYTTALSIWAGKQLSQEEIDYIIQKHMLDYGLIKP